jgi:hypothetical protein
MNDIKAVTDVEKAEDDPGADAIRGALNIRRFSTVRRGGRATNVDAGTGEPIHLQNRGASRRNREGQKDGDSGKMPSEWAHRESTIREVPPEEERKASMSSVQFDPSAPVTHIYPPKEKGPELGALYFEPRERQGSLHAPLSPVETPDFLSAPPTPRYTVPKRPVVQKQFSFGRGKKRLTEEETIGLVQAGRLEGGGSDDNDDRETGSPERHSGDSDSEGRIHYATPTAKRPGKSYDML